MDWKDLVKLVAPSAGALASGPDGAGSFMRGYNTEMDKIRVDRVAQRREEQQQKQFGARTGLELLATLQKMDDPIQQQQLLTAINANADAFGLPPGMFDQFPVIASGTAQLTELTKRLEAMRVAGMDLDDAGVREGILETKSGPVTVGDALALTKMRPIDPKTKKAMQIVRTDLEPNEAKPWTVRGANGEIEPNPVLVTWDKRRRRFVDENNNPMNVIAPYKEPDKAPVPPSSENERMANLLTRIGDAKAKGDTVLATQLQGEYDNLLKVRKENAEAGRKPEGPDALSAYQKFQAERGLHADWTKGTSSLKTMRTQMGMMNAAIEDYKKSPTAAQQTIIQTFNKILDDISVVRESEYARMGGGLSLLDRMDALWERATKGGGPVPASALDGIAAIARAFLRNQEAYEPYQRSSYMQLIKDNGLNPTSVFGDSSLIPANMTSSFVPPAGDGTTATPPPGTTPASGDLVIDELKRRAAARRKAAGGQ